MKKIIAIILITSSVFAQTKSDVSITAGYNKFDDPEFLKSGVFFYGIRGGIYQDNGYGVQVGFEHATGANCVGLDLNRFYTNGIYMPQTSSSFKPYALASLGYETSNIHEHKPSQLFVGGGVGVRKKISQNLDGYIETRLLKKLKSSDVDIITTLGISLALNSARTPFVASRRVNPLKYEVLDSGYESDRRVYQRDVYVEPQQVPMLYKKEYYVQLAAVTSSPDIYLQRFYALGVRDADIKQVIRGGREMFVIVSGPFVDRRDATRNLRKLKRVSRGAFVTKI